MVAHLLAGLRDIGLITQVDDALRDKRTVFHIAEPVGRLHQLIIQRHEPELIAGLGDRVWERTADTVRGKIYGPHFEELARQWCFAHADAETLGGVASRVLPTELPCRDHQRHELDVVVTERDALAPDRITAIGEAKGTLTAMDVPHLAKLEHLRGLLPSRHVTGTPKLLLFAHSGFTPGLTALAAARADVELVDLARLYFGS